MSRSTFYLLCVKTFGKIKLVGIVFNLFLFHLSELTGINMLSSQSGSVWNPPLLLSCSSLWFTAWYSMSSLSSAQSTVQMVASKNSTKAWHDCFQMSNCMAAQLMCFQVLSARLYDLVLLRSTDRKRFPHQSPGHHNCQVNNSCSFCRSLGFYNECMETRVIH